jgi:hypothetical protein
MVVMMVTVGMHRACHLLKVSIPTFERWISTVQRLPKARLCRLHTCLHAAYPLPQRLRGSELALALTARSVAGSSSYCSRWYGVWAVGQAARLAVRPPPRRALGWRVKRKSSPGPDGPALRVTADGALAVVVRPERWGFTPREFNLDLRRLLFSAPHLNFLLPPSPPLLPHSTCSRPLLHAQPPCFQSTTCIRDTIGSHAAARPLAEHQQRRPANSRRRCHHPQFTSKNCRRTRPRRTAVPLTALVSQSTPCPPHDATVLPGPRSLGPNLTSTASLKHLSHAPPPRTLQPSRYPGVSCGPLSGSGARRFRPSIDDDSAAQ